MKKKEQFSIALWDRLKKDNIPHSFETRGGDEVTQIHIFKGKHTYPIYGVWNNCVECWQEAGVYGGNSNQLDLFIVWEEEQLMLEGWLNVYGFDTNYFNNIHKTRAIADSNAMNGRIACVKVSIPYTKGEGLNNPKSN